MNPPWTLPYGLPILASKDVDPLLIDDLIESGYVISSVCTQMHEGLDRQWHGTFYKWKHRVETTRGDEKVTETAIVGQCNHGGNRLYYHGPYGAASVKHEPIDYKALSQKMAAALENRALTPQLRRTYAETVAAPLSAKELGYNEDGSPKHKAAAGVIERAVSWLRSWRP